MMTLAELLASDHATITVEQTAEVLRVSRGVAYEAARNGELHVLRLGRRILVSVPGLLKMLGADDRTSAAPIEESDPG